MNTIKNNFFYLWPTVLIFVIFGVAEWVAVIANLHKSLAITVTAQFLFLILPSIFVILQIVIIIKKVYCEHKIKSDFFLFVFYYLFITFYYLFLIFYFLVFPILEFEINNFFSRNLFIFLEIFSIGFIFAYSYIFINNKNSNHIKSNILIIFAIICDLFFKYFLFNESLNILFTYQINVSYYQSYFWMIPLFLVIVHCIQKIVLSKWTNRDRQL